MKTEYLKFIAGLSKKYYKKFGNIWWYSLLHEKNTNKTMTYHNLVLGNKPKKFSIITALLLGVKKYLSFWYRYFLYRGTKVPKDSKVFFITYGRYRGHFEPFEYSDGTWIYLPQKGGGDESLKHETAIDYFVDVIDLMILGFVYVFYIIKNILLVKELIKKEFYDNKLPNLGTPLYLFGFFKEEIYRSFFGDVLVEGLFYECAFGNMFKKFYLTMEKVIYVHEGLAWEKALLLYPYVNFVESVGLLCSCPAKNELNFYYDKEEVKLMPIPDNLGVLGESTYRVFKKMYGDSVFINGPMRFRYLQSLEAVKEDGKYHILVILPPDINHAKELLDWVRKNFYLCKEIVIKPHPSAPKRVNFNFSNWCSVYCGSNINGYLEKSSQVITASPSIAIIAHMLKIAVLCPALRSYVSMRPDISLEWSEDWAKQIGGYFDFSKDERRLLK